MQSLFSILQVFSTHFMMLLAKVLLVFLTFSITVESNLFCMTDCNSPFREPSLYEQVCCNQNNTGKTFKQRMDKTVTIILCPLTIPDSCQQQGKQINRMLITDDMRKVKAENH